jgi:transcriptional regulator with XRE-family HTH domain
MAIGDRIRKRREELGLTQQQLADRLGYKSKATINKIEAGINGISQRRIVDFAHALNTTIEYLMEMDDVEESEQHKYYYNDETAKVAQELFGNSDLRALLDAARGNSSANLKLATEMLSRMKGTNPDG